VNTVMNLLSRTWMGRSLFDITNKYELGSIRILCTLKYIQLYINCLQNGIDGYQKCAQNKIFQISITISVFI
jgi:hypothetical protein